MFSIHRLISSLAAAAMTGSLLLAGSAAFAQQPTPDGPSAGLPPQPPSSVATRIVEVGSPIWMFLLVAMAAATATFLIDRILAAHRHQLTPSGPGHAFRIRHRPHPSRRTSARKRITRKGSLAVAVSLLAPLGLAVAPAQAHDQPGSGGASVLLVADQGANVIREFSRTGVDLGNFATTGLNGPTALAVDRHGNVYVSNINGNTIRKFSPSGQDLGDFASTGLGSPRGIAFDNRGNLYVANVTWIEKFSPTGVDLGTFATAGLNVARGVAFDRMGNLYVANLGNNTVRRFSRTGADLGIFASTGFSLPALIAFDQKGNLYVTNFGGNTVREFSASGQDLGDFAATGLNNPAGLVFDEHGNLYVSNRGDGTIRQISRGGSDLGYFATSGLVNPVGLAFSSEPGDEQGD